MSPQKPQSKTSFVHYSLPLASYACHPDQSRGRLHDEPDSKTRSTFRRDCDRIIHTAAFRRLEYKTQVFINHEGDHYRTRLTHSLEVAQIARSLARTLELNEDLAETMALAHDLGHTPFGHGGEDALNEVKKDFGGFDHNAQTVRILTKLEKKYAEFDGLNLTWETLEGIAKHNGPMIGPNRNKKRFNGELPYAIAEYNAIHDLALDSFPSAEAQIAGAADDIAYDNHDIDDGLRAGLFRVKDLLNLPLVGEIFYLVEKDYPSIETPRLIHESIRRLIDTVTIDLIETTRRNIEEYNIQTVDDIRNLGKPLVHFSETMEAHNKARKAFLKENMYGHYRVTRMRSKARRVVQELFTLFLNEPECLPTEWNQNVKNEGDANKRAAIIADFIAGMTDRFAMEEHKRLFDLAMRC